MIEIKDIQVRKPDPNGLISATITIESEGETYIHGAKLDAILNDRDFESLCKVWKRDIEKKKANKNVDIATVEAKIKTLKGKKFDE